MRSIIVIGLLSLASGLSAQHETPASVLLFPLIRSSAEVLTIVSVTNVDTTPKTKTSYGGSTMVGFQYINVTENPMDGFRPLACTAFCRGEFLTPADTLSVAAYCHDIPFGGPQAGYLAVIAMDPERYKTPWSHEALIGSSLHVKASGAMYMMLPYPIHTRVPHHSPTDLNANQILDLDNLEYLPVPDRFYIDTVVPCFDPFLTVVSLTGEPMDLHTLYFSIWNDNEFPLSATITFNCWFEQPLWKISTVFTEPFLDMLPDDPSEIDINCDQINDLENAWFCVQSLGVANPVLGPITRDGAFIAYLTGGTTSFYTGQPLFESVDVQTNGIIPIR